MLPSCLRQASTRCVPDADNAVIAGLQNVGNFSVKCIKTFSCIEYVQESRIENLFSALLNGLDSSLYDIIVYLRNLLVFS